MDMDHNVRTALSRAAELESKHQFQEAAEAYRSAIAAAGATDPVLAGMLYINLGNAERTAGLVDKAITSYQRATELLDGHKGEAFLQRGYAFLNMAGQLLLKDDPRAVAAAAEALKIHRAYPYTTPTDLADAVALHFVTRLFLEKRAEEREFHATWKDVKAAPCAGMVRSVAFDFVSNYLLFMKDAHPDEYAKARAEVEGWAVPDLFAEAASLAEGGPDSYQAVCLQHRLQRALLGIPDPDSQ